MPSKASACGLPVLGKTLIAKAKVRQAFLSSRLLALEFVEMFGRGAAKVRDLFKQATKALASSSMTIDAVGKRCDASLIPMTSASRPKPLLS